jgi:hypothetical protein
MIRFLRDWWPALLLAVWAAFSLPLGVVVGWWLAHRHADRALDAAEETLRPLGEILAEIPPPPRLIRLCGEEWPR